MNQENSVRQPVTALSELLSALQPELREGTYVFSSVPLDTNLGGLIPLALFREREGLTVIAEESAAREAGLPVLFRAAWITLTVHSDLHAIGLTAAVSHALGQAGISCNVVAGACHDHLFVPVEAAQLAYTTLVNLQEARTTSTQATRQYEPAGTQSAG